MTSICRKSRVWHDHHVKQQLVRSAAGRGDLGFHRPIFFPSLRRAHGDRLRPNLSPWRSVTARNLLLEESPWRTNLGGIHGGERGLSHEADIAKVQEWLGHSNVSITKLYDRRKSKPEDSPTFRVEYKWPRKKWPSPFWYLYPYIFNETPIHIILLSTSM